MDPFPSLGSLTTQIRHPEDLILVGEFDLMDSNGGNSGSNNVLHGRMVARAEDTVGFGGETENSTFEREDFIGNFKGPNGVETFPIQSLFGPFCRVCGQLLLMFNFVIEY